MAESAQSVATPDPTETSADEPEGGGNGASDGSAEPSPADSSAVEEHPAPTLWSDENVYQRLAWVISQVGPIPKDQHFDGGRTQYDYRSIETIVAKAGRLLSQVGVVYTPRVELSNVDREPPNAHAGWQDVYVRIEWNVRGPKGDAVEPAPVTLGIGRDNSDKGSNKGHTQAKKYFLIDLLQIADPAAPDPDAEGDYGAQMTPDERRQRRAEEAADSPDAYIDQPTAQRLSSRISALPREQLAELVDEWLHEDPMTGESRFPLDPDKDRPTPAVRMLRRGQVEGVESILSRLERVAKRAERESTSQSLADRAASHAQKPAQDLTTGPQEPAGEPAAAERTGDSGESAEGDTEAAPFDVVSSKPQTPHPLPEAWGDLATKTNRELSDMLRLCLRFVDTARKTAIEGVVQKLHHNHVDTEIEATEGQSLAENEPIEHRRMRVMLGRLLMLEPVRLGVVAELATVAADEAQS